jgi:hypothetical protein
VISQFSSTQLKIFCHPVSFSVRTISCSTHVETTFGLVPRVHKHNFGQSCNRSFCDVADFEDLQFSPDRWYSSRNPRGKSPVVLDLVTSRALPGNRPLQSICSESVRLKTDGQFFQHVGALNPAGTMHHKAIAELHYVVTCPGMNGC